MITLYDDVCYTMALLTFLWVVIMRLCGLGEVGRGRRG